MDDTQRDETRTGQAPVPPPPPGGIAPPKRPGRGAGRIVALVIGIILAVISLGLLIGGGAALWADRTQRDADGFLTVSHAYETPTYAITVEDIDLNVNGVYTPFTSSFLDKVRIQVTPQDPSRPVFVGIAPALDAARYLKSVRRAQIDDFSDTRVLRTETGRAPRTSPGDQDFWVAQAAGSGTQTVDWDLRDGSWSVVVMNADGSPRVGVDAVVGAKIPSLLWIAIGLLIAGALFLAGGVALAVWGARSGPPPPPGGVPPPPQD